jgi:hypothetical protein
MALAFITLLDYADHAVSCRIDIGKSKYYQLVIGEEPDSKGGLPLLGNTSTSKLFGPLSADEIGRRNISVPMSIFTSKQNRLQLLSYADQDKNGVAVSDSILIPVSHLQNRKPSLSFSKNIMIENAFSNNHIKTYHTSFSVKENKMSTGMFWASLLPVIGGAVQSLLPTLMNKAPDILRSLTGGRAAPAAPGAATSGGTATAGTSTTATGAASGNALVQLLNSPEVSALLQSLLQQTLTPAANAPASPATARASSIQKQINTRYSEAKIAPALLAALPALLPLLQQVLSPETIGKVLDSPQKMIGAVTDSITKIGELGIASHEQDLAHLRALNPGTGPAVDALLASFSMTLSENKKLIQYKRISSVKVTFSNVETVDCEGKSCLIYGYGGKMVFPVAITAPKPIGRCVLQLSVKDLKTSKLLLTKNFNYKTAESIAANCPQLEPSEYKSIPSNGDYLFCISLIFKGKKKENLGTYASEVVHLTDSYVYASVAGKGEAIALNDTAVHRPFWHKIWSTRFSKELMRTSIHVKYYCVLTSDQEGIGKMETVTKPVKTDDQYGKSLLMKTGVKINIAELNKILPAISSYPSLSPSQLKAISAPEFLSSYHTVAQEIIKVDGFINEIAMFWAFPEVTIHELILKKIVTANAYGMVTDLDTEVVRFPLPSSLYLIGAKNGK